MLWNIVKGVVAAVVVKKITERYFAKKEDAAPVQLALDIPAKPRRPRKVADAPAQDPLNATESTI